MVAEYGISESTCGRIIRYVEEVLSESTHFKVPTKKRLDRSSLDIEVVVIDVTETPIERQKKQREYYSGKKKRHTLKSQILIDLASRRILTTHFGTGSEHDLTMFKQSELRLHRQTLGLGNYQATSSCHTRSRKAKISARHRRRRTDPWHSDGLPLSTSSAD